MHFMNVFCCWLRGMHSFCFQNLFLLLQKKYPLDKTRVFFWTLHNFLLRSDCRKIWLRFQRAPECEAGTWQSFMPTGVIANKMSVDCPYERTKTFFSEELFHIFGLSFCSSPKFSNDSIFHKFVLIQFSNFLRFYKATGRRKRPPFTWYLLHEAEKPYPLMVTRERRRQNTNYMLRGKMAANNPESPKQLGNSRHFEP